MIGLVKSKIFVFSNDSMLIIFIVIEGIKISKIHGVTKKNGSKLACLLIKIFKSEGINQRTSEEII